MRVAALEAIPSRKLTCKPKKGPIRLLSIKKSGYMGFHVTLGEAVYHLRTLSPGVVGLVGLGATSWSFVRMNLAGQVATTSPDLILNHG